MAACTTDPSLKLLVLIEEADLLFVVDKADHCCSDMYRSTALCRHRFVRNHVLPVIPRNLVSSSEGQASIKAPLNSILVANRGEIALSVAPDSNEISD